MIAVIDCSAGIEIVMEKEKFEALQESLRLNHPICDMLYLVLARRSRAVLLTLDSRLRRLATAKGITVVP